MKRSRFPLKEAVSGVLEMKRTLKLSWWQVMRTVIRTRKSEEGVSPFQLARQAAQVQRFEKAVFDGDLEEGVVFGGQAVGGIKDIPTCRELIARIMAEAEKALRETRALLS
jgi:NAD(P)H-dependent flavin oxidoreductase YrpB (nitropropane dioxygenase family)